LILNATRYWPDDRAEVDETEVLGVVEARLLWLAPDGHLLLREVASVQDSLGFIVGGSPPLYQPLPYSPRAASYRGLPLHGGGGPAAAAVNGLIPAVTIKGTDPGDTTVQPVPDCDCNLECRTCPITTRDGYVELAVVASCSRKCIALEFPPPDFDDVKGMSRGSKRQLEEDVTNRVRRYAVYWYATCVYRTFGAGNRVELPECVIAAVRAKFPNTIGEAYCSEKLVHHSQY
jgi:hypothetical protein